MPRPSSDMEERRIIWDRILEAALKYHKRTKVYGMQKVIADDSGLGTAAVSKWAKYLSKPEDATIRKLADLYDVSASWLGGHDDPPDYGKFGPPDEMLRRAADITELVVVELLPNGTTEQFVSAMRRANELLLEGKSDAEVRGQLFFEISQQKRKEVAAEPQKKDDSTAKP